MKNYLTIAAMFLTCMFANAQKGKFIISAGTTGNAMARAITLNDLTVKKSSVPIHLEAGYFLIKKLQFTLAFNLSSATSEDSIIGYSMKCDGKATSFMLRTNFFYVSKDKFQLGSGLALGLVKTTFGFSMEPDFPELFIADESGFGIHLNLLEARYFFTKNVGIYGNVGYQDQGLWGLGVIGKF